jgi:hypothetical protein
MVDSPDKGKSADLGKRYTITGEYYIIHAFEVMPEREKRDDLRIKEATITAITAILILNRIDFISILFIAWFLIIFISDLIVS